MSQIDPFANESESVQIGGLTVENRTDRVSIYGEIDITRDKQGLEKAGEILSLLKGIVDRLKSEELPDSIAAPEGIDTVANPFG